MKKNLNKSVIVFTLVSIIICSGIVYYSMKEQKKPENPPSDDTELIIYDHATNYVHALSQNKNVSDEVLDSKIEIAFSDTSLHFGKLIHYVPTPSHYSIHLCFYIQFEADPQTHAPTKIINVDHAEVEFDDAQSLKTYHGNLYYNHETSNLLYWDLNGSIYNGGSAAYKIEPRNSDSANIQYVLDGLYEEDTYIHDSGRLRLDNSLIISKS